jgi:hypothetical protein
MTQEQKDLLLKDLCARLPYGVKVQVDNHCWVDFRKDIPVKLTLDNSYRILLGVTLGYVKPYLFPLSSMTEEQIKEYMTIPSGYRTIDWFNKNHFDYRCLIENGLAIDATNLNIY